WTSQCYWMPKKAFSIYSGRILSSWEERRCYLLKYFVIVGNAFILQATQKALAAFFSTKDFCSQETPCFLLLSEEQICLEATMIK
ncbi:MAG TPA: hypothetical protein PLB44_09680, partial [Mesotoga prima]|nr:hypothetical protein [Mesotoga prima]